MLGGPLPGCFRIIESRSKELTVLWKVKNQLAYGKLPGYLWGWDGWGLPHVKALKGKGLHSACIHNDIACITITFQNQRRRLEPNSSQQIHRIRRTEDYILRMCRIEDYITIDQDLSALFMYRSILYTYICICVPTTWRGFWCIWHIADPSQAGYAIMWLKVCLWPVELKLAHKKAENLNMACFFARPYKKETFYGFAQSDPRYIGNLSKDAVYDPVKFQVMPSGQTWIWACIMLRQLGFPNAAKAIPASSSCALP